MKKIAYTVHGRPVRSFDGISPDIFISYVSPAVVTDLLRWENTHLFRFANQYRLSHSAIPAASGFRITDAEYESFIAFLRKEKFPLTGEGEKEIDMLEGALSAEGKDVIVADLRKLKEKLNAEKEKQYVIYKKEIKTLLESEIAGQYYYNWGKQENRIKDDETIKKAVEVLSNWEKSKMYLDPKN